MVITYIDIPVTLMVCMETAGSCGSSDNIVQPQITDLIITNNERLIVQSLRWILLIQVLSNWNLFPQWSGSTARALGKPFWIVLAIASAHLTNTDKRLPAKASSRNHLEKPGAVAINGSGHHQSASTIKFRQFHRRDGYSLLRSNKLKPRLLYNCKQNIIIAIQW